MLEKVGNKDIIVRNYTDNFNIKEYIQDELIPKNFPDLQISNMNISFHGMISEFLAQIVEDVHATSSLELNEAFITKAVLPSSIYANAAAYDIGYTYATPAKCNFALQLSLTDVIENAEYVQSEDLYRYILDKDTTILLGDFQYRLDYDVYIDYFFIDSKRVFSIYYNMEETNSISNIQNKYIKHQVSTIDWLVLFVELKQFSRKADEEIISDNLITTNSDIKLTWSSQIAGVDLVYISSQGQRIHMKMKPKHTKADVEPFVWYSFSSDNTLILSFNSDTAYWSPDFNSKIEYTIYTCEGADANFTSYDSKTGLPVKKTGENYSYNSDTKMVAICYTGAKGGTDKGTVETVRDDTIEAMNTVKVLSTDNDFQTWFDKYGKRHGSLAKFFKRRDDPMGRLFSEFVAIQDDTYIYPTNTLDIRVQQDEFDFVNSDDGGINKEFIIKPGHLWEYDESDPDIRNRVKMIIGPNGPSMVTDDILPDITDERKYIFTNPFLIKIHKDPVTSMSYNYLIAHTEWPEDEPIKTSSYYRFQLAQFNITRSLSSETNNLYHIQVVCVPVILDEEIEYVKGIGNEYPLTDNDLRVVLVMRNLTDGDAGYVEMKPTEIREAGSIVFEMDVPVLDNIGSDGLIEVDTDRAPNIKSLVTSGPHTGKIYLNSDQGSFNFITLMKDDSSASLLYEDPTLAGYTVTNKFRNNFRDLNLYQPMDMTRYTVEFSGSNDNYTIDMTLVPMLRYDIPLDDEKMKYFIQAFNDQYDAMKPVLDRMDGNDHIDIKLYNTYGRSNNYYIGPMDGDPVLKNSTILLDNVYVKIKLVISVYDRSTYTITTDNVVNKIIQTFNELNTSDENDLHMSELIHNIISDIPNVRYLRFLGFNEYDANKQSIFVKYKDISELRMNDLMIYVPEIIRADADSIEISEET